MKFALLFGVISAATALSNNGHHQYPAYENVDDDQNAVEDYNHQIFKKSIEKRQHHPDKGVTSEESLQEPCRLSFPTLKDVSTEFFDDIYSDNDVQGYMPIGVYPPRVPAFPDSVPYEKWTQYDVDYFSQDPRTSYNRYNVPYLYNPVPAVRSLPPVATTRIRETLSPDSDYDDNKDVFFQPYVRAVRSRDDYLEQIKEDAVMPNVLPTMPFPYMRAVGYQPHQTSYQSAPVAYFPSAPDSDCAIPLLFNCIPKISYGSLTNSYSGKPVASLPNNYRKESHSEASHKKGV